MRGDYTRAYITGGEGHWDPCLRLPIIQNRSHNCYSGSEEADLETRVVYDSIASAFNGILVSTSLKGLLVQFVFLGLSVPIRV